MSAVVNEQSITRNNQIPSHIISAYSEITVLCRFCYPPMQSCLKLLQGVFP